MANNAEEYQWQYSVDNGVAWTVLSSSSGWSGINTSKLSFTLNSINTTYKYRCAITGNNKTIYSNAVSVKEAIAPVITVQPTNVTVHSHTENASLHIEAENVTEYWWARLTSGDGSKESDWFKFTNDDVWTGRKTDTLTFLANTVHCSYKYCCFVTNDGITIRSDIVEVIVDAEAPVITVQPQNVVAPSSTEVVFKIEATNAETYRWQRKTETGEWTDIKATVTGYNTDTLTFTTQSLSYNYIYRCSVTGAEGTVVYSDSATLTKE